MRHAVTCARCLCAFGVALIVMMTSPPGGVSGQAPGGPAQSAGEWRAYGATNAGTKYSPLDQINRDTVKNLRIAWRQSVMPPELRQGRETVPVPINWQVTPLVVGGLMYISGGDTSVIALDPTSGKVVWFYTPPQLVKDAMLGQRLLPPDSGEAVQSAATRTAPGTAVATKEILTGRAPNRGVAYWTDGKEARIIAMVAGKLVALDAMTGKLIPTFGDAGAIDLLDGFDRLDGKKAESYRWTGVPLVVRDVIVLGGVPGKMAGDIRGFDVRTGKVRWNFHAVPVPGEFGNDTWLKDSYIWGAQAGVWGMLSADDELGYVYLPHESPGGETQSDFYGGHRPGANLFGDSLVCLDVKTGKRVWHYQVVHHDLWDWDLNAAPVLLDITVNGRQIKAVAQVSKQAFTYVFDRVTGQPVWPIEEKPVPAGDVPGEWYSPTQPIPTKPPAYDQQGVTIDDLIDFTPELRAAAIEIISKHRYGHMFTPPSIAGGRDGKQGTLQVQGTVTNAFNGAGVDPETGMLYVPSVNSAVIVELVPNPDLQSILKYRTRRFEGPRGGALIGAWAEGPQGLPLFKPPYGRLTAIDLNTGDIKWQVPNGNGPRDHPAIKHLNLPPLGQPGRAAPLVTKTMVFLGEGGTGGILALPPFGGGKMLRAYDKATGKVIWETELPGGTNGAPMTYMVKGKQYIVVAVGWQGMGSELVALSLPD